MNTLLEVIVCSVEDAREAEAGGAGRLEVLSRFDLGGLTPPIELVREIRRAVRIPLRVMLREHPNFAPIDAADQQCLASTAREFAESGVDGLVLGFLDSNSRVDTSAVSNVLAECGELPATFHHAFEETPDPFTAIEAIKAIPQIDRILSHAGPGLWADKFKTAETLAQACRPEIELLAGGGLDLDSIQLLRGATSIREFHVGTAARTEGRVDRRKVRELVRMLDEA